MILYAIPFTCSLAARLALAGLPHEVRWMRRFEHILDDGTAYAAINPKRRVPALALEDGELLTEIPVVLDHVDGLVADRPAKERRRLREWLGYLATELHRAALFPLFDPATPDATRDDVLTRLLPPTLAHLDAALADRPTLLGAEPPSPADHYLLWALTLLRLRFRERVPHGLEAYRARLAATPWISAALAEERAELTARS